MENKGCITCRKCEQIRSNFFCGRTRLSQKQLYNKHGFCSDYEPKEQIEKPMTNEEWIKSANTEQLAEFLADKCNEVVETVLSDASCDIGDIDNDDYWYRRADFVEWLKQPHTKE
jgi:hypothetical protein